MMALMLKAILYPGSNLYVSTGGKFIFIKMQQYILIENMNAIKILLKMEVSIIK